VTNPDDFVRARSQGTLRVAFFNRRDSSNPEGGGSELYVEVIAIALAEAGHSVTVYSADHGGAPVDEVRDGVRYVRRGGKISVLTRAWWDLLSRRLGPFDVIVDVQNGVPFLSPLAARTPVVTLVHHVHREMWPVVYAPRAARVGWWVESRFAPWLYRRSQYVAVSEATRAELIQLGVDGSRIAVVHNGVDPAVATDRARDPAPTVTVLGRLVPHKQVTHVLRSARDLRDSVPGVAVRIVGDGWWEPQLKADARDLGVEDLVTFTGFVDEPQKRDELARTWVLAMPSLKEGWGLVVVEAATYGVPAVAYRSAAGVAESIVDGETGLLVEGGPAEFTEALRSLLCDDGLRERLGAGSRIRASEFSWQTTANAFATVLGEVVAGRPPVSAMDPAPSGTDQGVKVGELVAQPVTLDGPSTSAGA
jgi:glycosyltransferase involved in cell wall biosynthesis